MEKRTIYSPNEIIIKGDVAEIVLYNYKCEEVARCLIDTEDVGKIEDYKWCAPRGRVITASNGNKIPIYIQHLIMGMKANKETHIDHIDRNQLNNRKGNLRFCTNKENIRNCGISKNSTSGYKGVFWQKQNKNWRAQIMVNRKSIHLGCFKDRRKAAKVYNKAAAKYFGAFACLNRLG